MNEIEKAVDSLVVLCKKQNISLIVAVATNDEIEVSGYGNRDSSIEIVNSIHKVVTNEFEEDDPE